VKHSVPVGQANRGDVFGAGMLANCKTSAPTEQAGRGRFLKKHLLRLGRSQPTSRVGLPGRWRSLNGIADPESTTMNADQSLAEQAIQGVYG
jgi:hypothetical protein